MIDAASTLQTSPAPPAPGRFDVDHLREQFPILRPREGGRPLVYLDGAATAQKPQAVIDAVARFYRDECSKVHRGVHPLAERASAAYEGARAKVQRMLGANSPDEIVFVRNTTEAINLVARSFAARHLRPGDEIVISAMERHSNIVPWQMLCRERGTMLRVIPVDDRGRIVLEEYERLLGPRARLVAVTHVSNVLGTVVPAAEMVEMAHRRNVPVLLDGAQAAPHLEVDVEQLDCDFYTFSGHKLYGPMGIGVLYGKADRLDAMSPYQGGGGMIRSVDFQQTTYDAAPHKFEAGTPNVAGAVGLAAAVDFLDQVGMAEIAAYEDGLLAYAADALEAIPGLRILGTAPDKTAIVSFVIEGVHPHDVGTILAHEGVATRTGHHCAQPLMKRLRVPATTRVSLGLYNTREEIDALVRGLHRVRETVSTEDPQEIPHARPPA